MDELYELIISKSKKGDQKCIVEVITKFYPLIKKYSKKLEYDGSNVDLIICLLESILYIPINKNINFKEDKYIVSYLNQCIKHKYFKEDFQWNQLTQILFYFINNI